MKSLSGKVAAVTGAGVRFPARPGAGPCYASVPA